MKMITLKISLKGIQPPIWRRIKIASQATLLDLHYVIQHAFGWTNAHLFMVKVGSMEFVESSRWEEDAYRFQSAKSAILGDIIPKLVSKNGSFTYVYDFGDYWEHEIIVEEIEDSPKNQLNAVCLDGRRACPPEDVGSIPGYYQLVEDFKNPDSEGFSESLTWLGYVYDPEAIDLDSANRFFVDYFEASRLDEDTIWTRNLPVFNPRFDFIDYWTDKPEHIDYAKDVAFRRDVITMLKYLCDNKVRGTKATGNFPRKAVREIAEGFVTPPVLDQKIGDEVYELRSEDEVPDMLFVHIFSNMTGLIVGGENKVWRVTHLGDLFMDSTPLEQVWFLTKSWFYQYHWDNCYPFTDVYLDEPLFIFQKKLLDVLLGYALGKPIEITKVLIDLEERLPGWLMVNRHGDMVAFNTKDYFLSIVVEPFEKLGLFEVVKEESGFLEGHFEYSHIVMTDYGKTLLKCFN